MEKEKADRTQKVNMADGIPGEPAGIFGCGIAEKEGDPSMGIFVNGDRKEKNGDLYDPLCHV
jgi:hypothetical protein